jgi:hypothetical protein
MFFPIGISSALLFSKLSQGLPAVPLLLIQNKVNLFSVTLGSGEKSDVRSGDRSL